MNFRYKYLNTNQDADADPSTKSHALTFIPDEENAPAMGMQNSAVVLRMTEAEATAYTLGAVYELSLTLLDPQP